MKIKPKYQTGVIPLLILVAIAGLIGFFVVSLSLPFKDKLFSTIFFKPFSHAAGDYDVVVVGAGTGGTSAAIQAARMGSKVGLVEETDWVGGQMTAAGVANMDEGTQEIRQSGIYKEFVDKIKSKYGSKPVGTCYWRSDSICFEPKIGQEVLKEMISAQSNITLLLRTKVTGVIKSGDKVTGVNTNTNGQLNTKVVIDATEYGDIIPMTGARYRVGNSTSDSIDSNACIQDITYSAVLKKYPSVLAAKTSPRKTSPSPTASPVSSPLSSPSTNPLPASYVPNELVMNNPPPGYATAKVNFEKIVAKNGFGWPFNFQYPVNWLLHNAYRGMPDSSGPNYTAAQDSYTNITKTGINWANDYPATLPYVSSTNPTLKVNYLQDQNYRKQANCEAKLKTLQFIYYVQEPNGLGEPQWSIANDQGFDTPYNIEENSCSNIPAEFKAIEKHFPPIPYVRESRRIIGPTTVTAKDIKRNGSPAKADKNFTTSLAVGDYGVDLHNCKLDANLETSYENSSDISGTPGPFQIPFEAFIPETINGFLAAEKNLSQTRLVNGATRLQPSTMLTGQGVGALASLATKKNIEPRNVKPIEVQKAVVDAKSPISLFSLTNSFTDVAIDNFFWPFVQIVSNKEIMIGYGNNVFGVNDPLLRSQMAVVLTRAFNLDTTNLPATATFDDVPLGYWARTQIEALYKAGITTGCSLTPPLYCPERNTTRAEFAVFLTRAMKLDQNTASTTPIFEDVPSDYWAFKFIQLMAEKGIAQGCSDAPKKYCPEDPTIRGQASAFITRALLSN